MPLPFTITLLATIAIIALSRFTVAELPWRRYSRMVTKRDIALLVVGMLGLVLHCVAMFFRGLIAPITLLDGYVGAVNELGLASVILYVIPALLVLVALRRQNRYALVTIATILVAVGVTMYDGGGVAIHLATIFAAATAIAATVAVFVRRPVRSTAQTVS